MINYNVTKSPDEINKAIDTLLAECWRATKNNLAEELEVLSKAGVEIPILLSGFGYYLAQAESDMEQAKENAETILEDGSYDLMKSVDPATDKYYSAAKAEKQVKNSESHKKAYEEYQDLRRQYRLLRRKYDSVAKSFDGIRSRLSVIKRDIGE